MLTMLYIYWAPRARTQTVCQTSDSQALRRFAAVWFGGLWRLSHLEGLRCGGKMNAWQKLSEKQAKLRWR